MSKPGLPQGTRDFSAEVVRKRNYIFNVIRSEFERYGFQPLETPAMENLDTLMGKYGDEGDKLIFKILNNGLERPEKHDQARADFDKVLSGKNAKGLTERALRYDLTIPFARYVAMNHGQLTFPFKRYQIQPVWRADRPQKGRYREFFQCVADVVGSDALINEVELATIYAQVFAKLRIPVKISLNSRKLLAALAEACGGSEKLIDITVAIDKLDKIGLAKVKEELFSRGLLEQQVSLIEQYLSIRGSNESKLEQVNHLLSNIVLASKGVDELRYVLELCKTTEAASVLEADFTLARGLNYYTGIIFEVKAINVSMGSIGGGGRYDDLTGLFGVPNLPGVGISFGVDRIYDVLEELDLFPPELDTSTEVLFFNLGHEEERKAFQLVQQLRSAGKRCELYHQQAKMDKQFKYAEKKKIAFIVIIGSKELQDDTAVVKNLATGQQATVPSTELVNSFK